MNKDGARGQNLGHLKSGFLFIRLMQIVHFYTNIYYVIFGQLASFIANFQH